MIKANLLNNDIEAKKKKKLRLSHFLNLHFSYILRFSLSLFIFGLFYFFYRIQIVTLTELEKNLQKPVNELSTKLAEKNKELKELGGGKDQRINAIKAKVNLLKYYSQQRLKHVRFFDQLTELIPEEFWIESISNTEKRIEIKGYALEINRVFEFLDRLKKENKDFEVVKMLNSNEVKVAGQKVFSYLIEGKYYPRPSINEGQKK